jgi:hypothetical protein
MLSYVFYFFKFPWRTRQKWRFLKKSPVHFLRRFRFFWHDLNKRGRRTFFTLWAALRVLVSYSRFPVLWSLILSGKYNRQSQSVFGATFLRVFYLSFGCRKETLWAEHSEQCSIIPWVVRSGNICWVELCTTRADRRVTKSILRWPAHVLLHSSYWFSFKPHEKRNGVTRIPTWLPFRLSRWEQVQYLVCGKVMSWRHVWGVMVEISKLEYTTYTVRKWLVIWAFL